MSWESAKASIFRSHAAKHSTGRCRTACSGSDRSGRREARPPRLCQGLRFQPDGRRVCRDPVRLDLPASRRRRRDRPADQRTSSRAHGDVRRQTLDFRFRAVPRALSWSKLPDGQASVRDLSLSAWAGPDVVPLASSLA